MTEPIDLVPVRPEGPPSSSLFCLRQPARERQAGQGRAGPPLTNRGGVECRLGKKCGREKCRCHPETKRPAGPGTCMRRHPSRLQFGEPRQGPAPSAQLSRGHRRPPAVARANLGLVGTREAGAPKRAVLAVDVGSTEHGIHKYRPTWVCRSVGPQKTALLHSKIIRRPRPGLGCARLLPGAQVPGAFRRVGAGHPSTP